MMSKRIILSVLLLLLVIACEDAIHLPLSSMDAKLVVVEGILTNENISHQIKLSQTYKEQNGNIMPISGALVKVTEGNNIYPLTEIPIGSGEYYTPVMRAVFGKIYTLSIQYQGKEYTASDSPVPVEPMRPLQDQHENNQYALILNPYGQNPNFIDHNISWENTDACTSGSTCKGKIVYYDLKTIDTNEIYKPQQEDFKFPLGTTIIRKKYSTSSAYKAFLRSLLSETAWRGGVFDVERANVLTNLSEGAIGFFAVSTVVSDTTIIVK